MEKMVIAVIGLGYVGLPLAVEFAKKYPVIGFDIDETRVGELSRFHDSRRVLESELLRETITTGQGTAGLRLCSDPGDPALKTANVYIITVPTPVDQDKKPDLSALLGATRLVGTVLKKNDLVIYESTVYPGCTEEDCVPLLEMTSGLRYNEEFFCGYSPERINVGDEINTLTRIVKVTSGSTPAAAEQIDKLYASIITAGTFRAPSIKVAEASKAIENAQRDLNISFMNELALIFDKMGLDTQDVLEAAGTKWNFLKFKPGLVGGHCIGVDPYYLTYKAAKSGYTPKVISSGRDVNEQIGIFIAGKVLGLAAARFGEEADGLSVLILGITFKENCSDVRNSGVLTLHRALLEKGVTVDIYDPYADHIRVAREYSVTLLPEIDYIKKYAAVILAVAHSEFLHIDIDSFRKNGSLIYDIKGVLDRRLVDARL